jgi:Rad3-related DNA helicase
MSKKPQVTNSVPELERFERAKLQLEQQLEPLQPLIDEYNAALEQANAAVRGRGIAIGDFKISREFDEFDADKLYELVGRDKFLEWGGAENTKRILSVDKTKLRSFIAAGKVPKGVVDQILTHQKQYSTPKPLRLA